MIDCIIHKGTKIGHNTVIELGCIIGHAKSSEVRSTTIGNNSIVRSGTIIYAGNKIGNRFRTGNGVNIRELNTIGNNVSIGTHSIIEHHIKIEDNVRIHSNVFIPEHTILRKGCWVGPGVIFTNAKYPNRPDTKQNLKGCVVHRSAVVGAGAVLLPGVHIGADSIVGAGAVVTTNVPPRVVVMGNPATITRRTYENDSSIR